MRLVQVPLDGQGEILLKDESAMCISWLLLINLAESDLQTKQNIMKRSFENYATSTTASPLLMP